MRTRSTWIRNSTLALTLVGLSACEKQPTTTPEPDAASASAEQTADVEAEPEATELVSILSKSSFDQTINDNFGDVSDCYIAALEGNPELAGTLETSFTIDAEGKVSTLTAIEGSTLDDPGMIECLIQRAQSWQFDKPASGDEMVLEYPFNLEPAE